MEAEARRKRKVGIILFNFITLTFNCCQIRFHIIFTLYYHKLSKWNNSILVVLNEELTFTLVENKNYSIRTYYRLMLNNFQLDDDKIGKSEKKGRNNF